MAVDEHIVIKAAIKRAEAERIEMLKKQENDSRPCYLVRNGSYLSRLEVNPSGIDHARVAWRLTEDEKEAIVFCSQEGAAQVAKLLNQYVTYSRPGGVFSVKPKLADAEHEGTL